MTFLKFIANFYCPVSDGLVRVYKNLLYNYTSQGRNQEFITGGARPGTGGHSLPNKDFAKNFRKMYIKLGQKFRIFKKNC